MTFETESNQTKVTWAMHGPATYISKIMGLFFSMDNLAGGQCAEGLANLKPLAAK